MRANGVVLDSWNNVFIVDSNDGGSMLVHHGGDKKRYQQKDKFRENIAKHWPAPKLAWVVVQVVVGYPKMSKPVYEDNVKSPLMMAKPKNCKYYVTSKAVSLIRKFKRLPH